MQTGIDFTARCMAAEASEQINKASTGFADLDTRLDTMDIAIEQAQQAIHFKGFVNYYDDLPDDAEENDAYTVLYSGTSGTEQDGTEYVWSEYDNTYGWNPWGKLTYSQAQIDNKLSTKQDTTFTSYTVPSQEETITSNTTVQDAVEQLDYRTQINKTNILSIHKAADLYFSETEPTGTIAEGSYWISTTATKVYTNSDIWTGTIEQGSWAAETLTKTEAPIRCRTDRAIPVNSSVGYSISLTGAESNVQFLIQGRNSDGQTINESGWQVSPYNYNAPLANIAQMTVLFRKGNNENLSPTDIGTLSIITGAWS